MRDRPKYIKVTNGKNNKPLMWSCMFGLNVSPTAKKEQASKPFYGIYFSLYIFY